MRDCRLPGSKSGSGRWSHSEEIGWVHSQEIGWSHSQEIRGVQSQEILHATGCRCRDRPFYFPAIIAFAFRGLSFLARPSITALRTKPRRIEYQVLAFKSKRRQNCAKKLPDPALA